MHTISVKLIQEDRNIYSKNKFRYEDHIEKYDLTQSFCLRVVQFKGPDLQI